MTTQLTRSRLTTADPAQQAFWLLRTVFTVAPIVFGLDKFANVLTDWPQYLAPWIDGIVPGTAQQAMYAVGVVEIAAGLVVAVLPRFGAWLVAAWLAGIIVNLLTLPGFYDVPCATSGCSSAPSPSPGSRSATPPARGRPTGRTNERRTPGPRGVRRAPGAAGRPRRRRRPAGRGGGRRRSA